MDTKFKKGAKISTSDFWYDLIDGGYIKPTELMSDKSEAKKVVDAITIIRKFRNEAESSGVLEDF